VTVGCGFPTWVAWLLPIEITLSVSALYELIGRGARDDARVGHQATLPHRVSVQR